MSDAQVLRWFPFAFPFLFAGMWLLVTTLLGFSSGWFNLQQWYPDEGREEPLLRLRRQSGTMGSGLAPVALGGILTLAACPSGLSIRISRLFGPFHQPLLVPWPEITAEPVRTWFTPMVRLSLGGEAKLKIAARVWARLVAAAGQARGPAGGQAAGGAAPPPAPAVGRGRVVRGMLLEWLGATAFGAAFFYFAPRLLGPGAGDEPGVPLAVCIGLPAIVFGIGQAIRFAREG